MYHYKLLPMGVCQAPDFAQQIMKDVICDMEDVEVYINDIGVFNNDWEFMKTVAHSSNPLQDDGLLSTLSNANGPC